MSSHGRSQLKRHSKHPPPPLLLPLSLLRLQLQRLLTVVRVRRCRFAGCEEAALRVASRSVVRRRGTSPVLSSSRRAGSIQRCWPRVKAPSANASRRTQWASSSLCHPMGRWSARHTRSAWRCKTACWPPHVNASCRCTRRMAEWCSCLAWCRCRLPTSAISCGGTCCTAAGWMQRSMRCAWWLAAAALTRPCMARREPLTRRMLMHAPTRSCCCTRAPVHAYSGLWPATAWQTRQTSATA